MPMIEPALWGCRCNDCGVALFAGAALAEGSASIRQRSPKPSQKTPEVSTEQMRRIMADRSAITRHALACRVCGRPYSWRAQPGRAAIRTCGRCGAAGERGKKQGPAALLQWPVLPGQPAFGRTIGGRRIHPMCDGIS